MPTATLQFNLPEESTDHLYAIHGLAAVATLSSVRRVVKYATTETDLAMELNRVLSYFEADTGIEV